MAVRHLFDPLLSKGGKTIESNCKNTRVGELEGVSRQKKRKQGKPVCRRHVSLPMADDAGVSVVEDNVQILAPSQRRVRETGHCNGRVDKKGEVDGGFKMVFGETAQEASGNRVLGEF